ncbi:MAG: pyridoxal-phosphate dependent enzyme [Planctomycetota bacterium]|jgi:threonine dehydratase|nr:pyridoxal-phosphate dependent enzyme [Planctomycetota bacterium]MDP6763927.1 pyridoxal-phosphate dependent enzyme [Planctomycetota bacterium]MDP6988985.1 pyridoxal-phosphate dependent enzyme [Planctomycetota bacterium]
MAEALAPRLEEFEAAARLAEGVLAPTALVPFDEGTGAVSLKVELDQPTGSFKPRGVFHAVARMDPRARARGISTVSAGNTAKALAWAGSRFGVAARSLMPVGAPRTKIEAVRELGGTPVLVERDELFRFLREAGWEDEPYAFVHPWTDRDVLVGHGTLGLEIAEQAPDVETVFVPVGGGGLLGGVGSALRAALGGVRLVAVEPAGCPSLSAALAAGEPVEVGCETICDGVAVPAIAAAALPLLARLTDEVVVVEEEEVRAAIRALAEEAGLIVEGAGALALAAARRVGAAGRGRAVCLVTGGAIDEELLEEILGVGRA